MPEPEAAPEGSPAPTPGAPKAAAAVEADPGAQDLGKAAMLGLLASAATIALGIARSKVTATVLGPEGLGKSSYVLQLFQLVAAPTAMLTGPVLVTALTRAIRDGDREGGERAFDTALTLLLTAGALLVLAAGLAGLGALPAAWSHEAVALLPFAGLHVFGNTLVQLPTRALQAAKQFARSTVASVTTAVAGTGFIIVGTLAGGLLGQFVGLALAPFAGLLVGWWVGRSRVHVLGRAPRPRVDRGYLREVFSMGLASLVAGLALQGSLSAIRWWLERQGGPALNGQFQASWAVGNQYFTAVLGSLSGYVFPRYASAETREALAREVEAASDFVMRTAPPMILAVIALREPILHLLYSTRFHAAAELLGYQMAGDVARALGWAHAGALLYRGRVRAYFVTEVVGAGGLALLVISGHYAGGVRGLGVGYAINEVGYALVTALMLRLDSGVALRPSRFLAMAGITVALVAVAATSHLSVWVRVGALAVAAWGIWRSGLPRRALDKVAKKLRQLRGRAA